VQLTLRVFIAACLVLSLQLTAQVADPVPAASTPASATGVINQARLGLIRGVSITDLTLSGTASWTDGDNEQAGDVVIKVRGTTQSRIDLTGGTSRSEIRNDVSVPAGQWIDSNGSRHWMAPHNCWVPAGLLLPHALLDTALGPNVVSTYLGKESRRGATVEHVRITHSFHDAASLNSLAIGLSRTEIYLDATSYLPVAVTFTQQLDHDAERSIPAEIEFSDYQTIDGMLIPFHIHRTIGSLNLDINVKSAAANKGLSDSDFALQ